MSGDDEPWFEEYERFGIQETLRPYPDEPVHSLLYEAAEAHPNQGVVQGGRKYTYPELVDHVDRLATALRERGVAKGSRVATVLPTSVQFLLVAHSISRAGGVHVPNDFLDATEDLVARLERGDPEMLVGADEHRDLLLTLREELDCDSLVLTSLDDYSATPPPSREDVDGAEWLLDVVRGAAPNPPDVSFDADEDVHTVLFTGGTTGTPKGCRLTHRNLLANALQTVAIQGEMAEALRGTETALLALPTYHAYGYTVANVLVELALDVLVVPDARDTGLVADLVETHEPLVVFGVPTQFGDVVDRDLATDVVGISGAAPLGAETKAAFARTNRGLSQGYGLSEMSAVTHFDVGGLRDVLLGESATADTDTDTGFDRPTIGVPVPDTEVRLVGVDSGEVIPLRTAVEEGRAGEMLLKGPQRMKGYLGADSRPFDDDGFVPTGDVVRLDRRGRFYVVDRAKDMINVSGLKVYSREVDEVLDELEGVGRPATVGIPDPDRPGSERVRIYVEPEPGYEDRLTEADVREHLEGRVPKQAMPSTVVFVDDVPLTDLGKVDKAALRNREP